MYDYDYWVTFEPNLRFAPFLYWITHLHTSRVDSMKLKDSNRSGRRSLDLPSPGLSNLVSVAESDLSLGILLCTPTYPTQQSAARAHFPHPHCFAKCLSPEGVAPWPTVPVTPHPAVLLRVEIPPSLFLGLLRSRLPVAFLCTLKCAKSWVTCHHRSWLILIEMLRWSDRVGPAVRCHGPLTYCCVWLELRGMVLRHIA